MASKDIVITTENKAVIMFLMNVYTTSNLVHECRINLNAMLLHSNVLLWIRDLFSGLPISAYVLKMNF